MSRPRPQTLIADAGLTPANLAPLIEAADAWYQAEPSTASFVVRAVFRELQAQGLGDEQGVPTAEVTVLQGALLPPLNDLFASLDSGNKGIADALDALAKACRNHVAD
jgi:hypothetical protein